MTKRVSVIIPVYNGAAHIQECLEKVFAQTIPREQYEVIVIDDGSRDGTEDIAKQYPVRIVRHEQNLGRAAARRTGAREAKYDQCIFLDVRIRAFPDLFAEFMKTQDAAVVGNVIPDPDRGVLDRIFYLLRKRLYGKSWGEYFAPIQLTDENFDHVGKGTGLLYCPRDAFLACTEEIGLSHDVSDDTALLRALLVRMPILKRSEPKGRYESRENLRESLRHLFQRGPKFVDYYFHPGRRYFPLFFFVPVFWLVLAFTLVYPFYFVLLVGAVIIISCVLGLLFMEQPRDIMIVGFIGPIVLIVFSFGILIGMIKRLYRTP